MSERQVFFKDRFVPESQARISIYDSALMFGDMVFEMTRSFNQKQFKLREHLDRLYASMKHVHIPLKMTRDEMEAKVNETIKINSPHFKDTDEHRIMINVTRGGLSIYHGITGLETEPFVVIADFPLKWTVASMGPLYDTGINAVIPSQRAIPSDLLDARVKNRSRLHYQMGNIQVSQTKGKNNWALLLDPDGFIAEGTGDNVFIVKNGEVLTPEPRNILNGISRQYVLELAKSLGIPARETNLLPYDMANADEAFLTGTPFCMLPVCSLDGSPIGKQVMGPITRQLLDQWGKNVGVDIVKQIKAYHRELSGKGATGPSPYQFSEPSL